MAQPPLSQSIRRLELDLGIELFDRTRRGVELTQAGRIFLHEARRTLMQAELARKMAARAVEGAVEVRISFIGPALYRVLPRLLVSFREAYPDVNVRLYEETSPEQTKGILAGDFDIGFVSPGVEHIGACETMVIERTGLVAAVPADWPIAKEPSVTMKTLSEHPYITPPQKYLAYAPDYLAMFKNLGLMPVVTQEVSQTNTMLSLTGVGLGCSIVMATAALISPRNVKFLPILDSQPHWRWELLVAFPFEHLSVAAAAFIGLAKDQLGIHPEWLDAKAAATNELIGAC